MRRASSKRPAMSSSSSSSSRTWSARERLDPLARLDDLVRRTGGQRGTEQGWPGNPTVANQVATVFRSSFRASSQSGIRSSSNDRGRHGLEGIGE